MSVHLSEKDLARMNLAVNSDGTALVPVSAADDLAVFDKPPTLATMPGTEIAEVRPMIPDAEWSLGDLGQYAKQRLTNVTTSIFQAGRALRLARDYFKETRDWGNWLKQHRIPRTSAWESIELFEKAKTEEAVANLTRNEALKKFGIRKIRGKPRSAGAGNGNPPKPPVGASSAEGPPRKEDSLLLNLAKTRDWLDLCYERRDQIDWSKEDAISCMKMIDELYVSRLA